MSPVDVKNVKKGKTSMDVPTLARETKATGCAHLACMQHRQRWAPRVLLGSAVERRVGEAGELQVY
jgi:hypothetical protein